MGGFLKKKTAGLEMAWGIRLYAYHTSVSWPFSDHAVNAPWNNNNNKTYIAL